MHENNISALLAVKTLVEQAAWHRMFAFYNVRSGEWKKDYQIKFTEYMLARDKKIEQNLGRYNNDKEWKKILADFRDQVIKEKIVSRLRQYQYLSLVPAEELVAWAQALGAFLATSLKTNQIRRFLDAILEAEVNVKKDKPEQFSKQEAEYLKVFLAYATGRNRDVLPLLTVVDPMINLIRPQGREGYEDFNQLVRFVRAVVAYHKFYGGE